ncbi:hypothetical protein [Candidatus Entotheonella palauensis]|nr:hypothetical protein [Candidatus Entotheonella palauensis]
MSDPSLKIENGAPCFVDEWELMGKVQALTHGVTLELTFVFFA